MNKKSTPPLRIILGSTTRNGGETIYRMKHDNATYNSLKSPLAKALERGFRGEVSVKHAFHHLMQSYLIMLFLALLTGCTFGFDSNTSPLPSGGSSGGGSTQGGDTAQVVQIIDGDTIDVQFSDGTRERVRYVGVNTPERDEVCYNEAKQANAIFVEGKTVRLVKDVSDTDQYDRLLRYVYVGDLFVNRALVEQGYAEAVVYDPDRAHYDEFVTLEKQANSARRGCHPSGIFNDGSYTR